MAGYKTHGGLGKQTLDYCVSLGRRALVSRSAYYAACVRARSAIALIE